jgi:2,3,4,5-tetrahydropyridine-2,6-dicarboxylate N-succinyltransferase
MDDSPSLGSAWAQALEGRFSMLYDPQAPDLTALRSLEAATLLGDICDALEQGTLRMTERLPEGWRTHGWVQLALMLLAGSGKLVVQPGALPGTELSSLGWTVERSLDHRIPAGSFIRRGAYLAPGCVVMPPSVIQAGAHVSSGVLIDSHALVGSGAVLQPGVSVGCGTMIGGVLAPAGTLGVVLERGVVLGGNCGLYGPMIIAPETQIVAGTVIRSIAGIFDLRSGEWLRARGDGVLMVPAGLVVQMGVPPVSAFPDGIQRLTPLATAIQS